MGISATDQAEFALTGIPINADFYQLRAESIGVDGAEQEQIVATRQLRRWLEARQCEFCAHQVKLLREVRCSHPPFTAEDLSALGFQQADLMQLADAKP